MSGSRRAGIEFAIGAALLAAAMLLALLPGLVDTEYDLHRWLRDLGVDRPVRWIGGAAMGLGLFAIVAGGISLTGLYSPGAPPLKRLVLVPGANLVAFVLATGIAWLPVSFGLLETRPHHPTLVESAVWREHFGWLGLLLLAALTGVLLSLVILARGRPWRIRLALWAPALLFCALGLAEHVAASAFLFTSSWMYQTFSGVGIASGNPGPIDFLPLLAAIAVGNILGGALVESIVLRARKRRAQLDHRQPEAQ